jgi:hypothetical protein
MNEERVITGKTKAWLSSYCGPDGLRVQILRGIRLRRQGRTWQAGLPSRVRRFNDGLAEWAS